LGPRSWHAKDMHVCEKPFTNTDEGDLTVLNGLIIESHLLNEGLMDVGKLLQVSSGVNRGTLTSNELAVGVQMTNEGKVSLQKLSGKGKFQNHGDLNFLGTSSEVSICELHNETKAKKPPARVSAQSLSLREGQKSFVNGENSVVKVDQFHATNSNVENSGTFETNRLEIEKGSFENTRQGTMTVLAKTDVKDSSFINGGTLTTKGEFTQNQGALSNTGSWTHTGLMDTGSTSVTNLGTMNWQEGMWRSTATSVHNRGDWKLDNVFTCHAVTVHNHKLFHLKNGKVCFKDLINNDILKLSRGLYTVQDSFQNNHLLKFLGNDWVITDEALKEEEKVATRTSPLSTKEKMEACILRYTGGGSMAAQRFDAEQKKLSQIKLSRLTLPKEAGKVVMEKRPVGEVSQRQASSNPLSTKEKMEVLRAKRAIIESKKAGIESQKSLTYDVKELPKEIRAQGDVIFTKRHQQDRTLDDLLRVISPTGKVTFYCPATTTSRDYEFANIGHLDLIVDEPFTTHYSFTAPILTLTVNGLLTCGASNDVMGAIAATSGSLTMTAHGIDNRFGKISGVGPTVLKATKGPIQNGSPTAKGPYLYNMNKSIIVSGSTLQLHTSEEFNNKYGKVLSQGDLLISALGRAFNVAGKILSLGDIYVDTPIYSNTRDSYYDQPVGNWTRFYSDCHALLESSDEALMSCLGNIYFKVDQGNNLASSIMASKGIFYKPFSQGSFSPEKPLSFTSKGRVLYGYGHIDKPRGQRHQGGATSDKPSNLLAGHNLEINTGDFDIKCYVDAGKLNIRATGKGLFDGTGMQQSHGPIQALLYCLTDLIQDQAKGDGFVKRNAKGEIVPYYPMGSTYNVTLGNNGIMLVNKGNQHLYQLPLYPSIIFNSLRQVPMGLFNLYAQSEYARSVGTVRVAGNQYEAMGLRLFNNGVRFRKKLGKRYVSYEELVKLATEPMLLRSLEEEDGRVVAKDYTFVPADAVNRLLGTNADEIDVHTEDDLTVRNAKLRGKYRVTIHSEKKVLLESTVKTHVHENGSFETIENPTTVECTQGPLIVVGKTGFRMTGAKLRAALRLIAGSSEGNSDIQNVQLQNIQSTTHVTDGGLLEGDTVEHTTQVMTSSHPSELESETGDMLVLSGKQGKTTITGSLLKAFEAIFFEGNEVEANADIGKNTTMVNTHREGVFSSAESRSQQETANIFPTKIEAKAVYTNTQKATYRGTDFMADVLYDNTKEGTHYGSTVEMLTFYQQMISQSAFAKIDVGCKGGNEVMAPCSFAVNKIVRTLDEGQMRFESVDWDKNRTEIIGKFAETTYQLKQWQTSWAIHEPLIPDAALVVVALAITIATQGAGATLAQGLMTSTLGTVPTITAAGTIAMVPAVTLTATGAAMASAGLTALCTQAASSFLKTGDPIATAKSVFSIESLKSIGISVASAGLCSQMGSALDIDMNPSLKEVLEPGTKPLFTDFLQSQALKGGVNASLNVAVAGEDPGQAIISAVKQIPLNAVGAYAAYTVGDLGFQGEMNTGQQDVAHTVIGAALGGLQHTDNPLEGALVGGANAFVASHANRLILGSPEEIAAQAKQRLKDQGLPVTPENMKVAANDIVHVKTAIPTLLAASATAAITRDPGLVSTGIFAANNVTENNCIPSLTKSLMMAEYGAQEEGEEGFWKTKFQDPNTLYYQMVLEAAFPDVPPSKIKMIISCIEQFRQEHPRLSQLINKGLEGIGTGVQCSYYASAILAGFVMGEFVNPVGGGFAGAYLSLSMAKSLEAPMNEAVSYLMSSSSPDSQSLLREILPLTSILNLRVSKMAAQLPKSHGETIPQAVNRNTPQRTLEGLDLAGPGKPLLNRQKNTTVLTADKIHPSSSIKPLEKPGRVVFDGVEFRAVRDLGHMSEDALRDMHRLGKTPTDVYGNQLRGHHNLQMDHRHPEGFIVEMPGKNHRNANQLQHPHGNLKGKGLTHEQRADWDKLRSAFHKERAKQELMSRGILNAE
jgi:adhesin HecA-like repeat protein